MAADPEIDIPAYALAGTRAVLATPLLRDGKVEGAMALVRTTPGPFTQRQIELVQTFADQAVIAIENARLFEEVQARTRDLEESLQQQTATSEVLQVISSSAGDVQPVFEKLLENATRVCGAEFGTMNLLEDSQVRNVALHNAPPAYASLRANRLFQPHPESALGRSIRTKQVVQVDDLRTSPAYLARSPLFATTGARTLVVVPMLRDDELIGTIVIYRTEVRPFSDKQIELLKNFASQAVIAIENAQLFKETKEALERQTATSDVLQVISSSPGDLDPVFRTMLEKATRICGADFGLLNLIEGDAFRPIASHNVSAASIGTHEDGLIHPHPQSGLGTVKRTRQIVHIDDLRIQPPYREGDPDVVAISDIAGARTLVVVPLLKDNELIGTISIYRQEVRPFSDKQVALLGNFASQAVIAIENTRLIEKLRERTDQVAELNRGLEARVAEQVEELGRVGRLKRFLAPQLAELIVSQGNEKILESHRREIVVVFCDLRGYTAFTETAEPEEVLSFLREYHGALGPLVSQFEGTLDQFSGDGIMVFFNDPVPIPDPAERAVKMAVAMREAASSLTAAWRERGRELGFGAGIAQGYATLGPDRIFRTLRIHRNWHRVQCGGAALRRGQGRPNSAQSARPRVTQRKRSD
jgi:adenylate cyclase